MDIRKVQKTGDMNYLYLPTSWCKKYTIGSNSRVSIEQNTEGNLIISPKIGEKKQKNLRIKLNDDNENVIHKMIIACYINPLNSFVINLERGMDFSKLLNQKKLISLESVELDKNLITCESNVSISDPASILKTMVRKIKNMLTIMTQNYNLELIHRYEEEIDRSRLLIEKSVISYLTFDAPSKLKTIETYYISIISRDLERMVDHLIRINKSEIQFLNKVSGVIDNLKEMIENPSTLHYDEAIKFLKKTENIKETEIKDIGTYDQIRIKHILFSISEVLIDWAITNEIDKD